MTTYDRTTIADSLRKSGLSEDVIVENWPALVLEEGAYHQFQSRYFALVGITPGQYSAFVVRLTVDTVAEMRPATEVVDLVADMTTDETADGPAFTFPGWQLV